MAHLRVLNMEVAMDSATKLDSSTWNPEGPTRPVVTEPGEPQAVARTAPGASRTLYVLVGLQVVLLAGVAAGAVVLRDLVLDMRKTAAATAEVTHTQLAALTQQQQALQNEVNGLRELMASRTGEDVVFLKIMVLRPSIDPEVAKQIARSVSHYSALYGRDPDLVLAIMDVESNFEPKAVSHVGATGLMQVMPHWKKVLGIQGELSDIDTSVQYGMQVLGFYQEMYKDLELALTAYNRGPGPVDNALVKGRSPNNGYAPKVLQVYQRLKKLNAGRTPQTSSVPSSQSL